MEIPRLPHGVELRRATVDDAAAGARLHTACWREAYGPIVDPALLEPRLSDPDAWAARWRQQIDEGAERTVAVAAGELVGFVATGPARHEEAATDRELRALYVRETWHGTGIGAALLAHAIGDEAAYLWVLEDDRRARAFYVKHGFRDSRVRELNENLDAWEVQLMRP